MAKQEKQSKPAVAVAVVASTVTSPVHAKSEFALQQIKKTVRTNDLLAEKGISFDLKFKKTSKLDF